MAPGRSRAGAPARTLEGRDARGDHALASWHRSIRSSILAINYEHRRPLVQDPVFATSLRKGVNIKTGLADTRKSDSRTTLPERTAPRAQRELHRLIAESSGFWEYLEDPGGKLVWVSPACEAVTGRRPDEFLRDPALLRQIVHPEDRAPFASHRSACRLSDVSDAASFRIVRSDGAVRWIRHVCKPVFFPDENAFGRRTSNQDVTEVKKSEQELLRLNRTLRAVSNTNQAMLHATDEAGFLEDVCRIVVEDCGHAGVWVGFAEEDEPKSVRPVAQAGFEHGDVEALGITGADTERGRGPTGTAIRTGKPVFCRNMLTDPDFAPWREEALKRGYASSIVLPLLQDGKSFGAITIYSREPDSFSGEEVGLLSELAGDLAYGITSLRSRAGKAEAERERRESEKRYRTLFDSMKEAFVVAEMIYDDEGKPFDFRHLNVNPAFTGLTGLPADRAVGRTIREVIPGFEPFWIEAFDRVVKSGVGERVEGPVSNLGRQYEAFAWRSDPGRFAVVFSDITKRKEAERRLRELNETLEQRVLERTAEAEDRAVQLWALASKLTQAELKERQRLAGVLHDHLQQVLVAAKFNLDALKGKLTGEDLGSL
ncbi:MAG: GAF domain-containing protein, partial [Acidithiobacillales bacterium]